MGASQKGMTESSKKYIGRIKKKQKAWKRFYSYLESVFESWHWLDALEDESNAPIV